MTPLSPLHQHTLSLDHEAFVRTLAEVENLLIVQDLDGVCMGLVKDPLTRIIDPHYVAATQRFDGHFFVLTNGEHGGQRGVNGIVERACGRDRTQTEGLYLPGLAAGGVQWQTGQGKISHPGVSEQELTFLATVPQTIKQRLEQFFQQYPDTIAPQALQAGIQASVLDNMASPSANLNTLGGLLGERGDVYQALQKEMAGLMTDLLTKANHQGLADSFFVHYAPNLGRDGEGRELMRLAHAGDLGTTDFQFMLRGAIKEAGVLVLLNHYYYQRTGTYPLGKSFNARQAPKTHKALLQLVTGHFDPAQMPLMVGVGDTVTSQVDGPADKQTVRRGGSDRNFLYLIQAIGRHYDRGNLVAYVDSSHGEVKNRKSLRVETHEGHPQVIEGPGDPNDRTDPLQLNIAFPGGYQQYTALFQQAARQRQRRTETQ